MNQFLSLFLAAALPDLVVAGIICIVIGLVLCCIETLIPGIGLFGISGGLCFLAGEVLLLVARVPSWIVVLIFAGGVVIIAIMIWLIGKSIKKGKLGKSEMFDVGVALPSGLTEGTKDFSGLIGKTGMTTTLLRPVGVTVIDGQVYDCLAKRGIIEPDTLVKVVAVEGQRIVVEEV